MMSKRTLIACALPLVLGASGCENIGLINWDDPDRRRVERDRDHRISRDSRDRNLGRDEVVGTVERVDDRNNELHIRTTEGRVTVVQFDSGTIVYDRDRELRVRDLRRGDQVLVRVDRNSRGDQYAGVIRMNDRSLRY
jgi:hypothetical protein